MYSFKLLKTQIEKKLPWKSGEIVSSCFWNLDDYFGDQLCIRLEDTGTDTFGNFKTS